MNALRVGGWLLGLPSYMQSRKAFIMISLLDSHLIRRRDGTPPRTTQPSYRHVRTYITLSTWSLYAPPRTVTHSSIVYWARAYPRITAILLVACPVARMMKRPAAAEPETARGRKRSASVSLPDSPKRKRQTSASSSSAGPVKLDGLYEVEETCVERYRREPPPPTCGLWVGNRWVTDTGIHIIGYTYPWCEHGIIIIILFLSIRLILLRIISFLIIITCVIIFLRCLYYLYYSSYLLLLFIIFFLFYSIS